MNNKIIKFVNGDLQLDVGISPEQNTVWLTVEQICTLFNKNYICLFDYLFISSQMSAKPYFIGSTGILLLW